MSAVILLQQLFKNKKNKNQQSATNTILRFFSTLQALLQIAWLLNKCTFLGLHQSHHRGSRLARGKKNIEIISLLGVIIFYQYLIVFLAFIVYVYCMIPLIRLIIVIENIYTETTIEMALHFFPKTCSPT